MRFGALGNPVTDDTPPDVAIDAAREGREFSVDAEQGADALRAAISAARHQLRAPLSHRPPSTTRNFSKALMRAPRPDPFPFEAVRDLLGILRALYVSDKARGSGKRRLAAIREVALELRRATDLAMEYEPGTLGHAAAWDRAEQATYRVADLVDVTTPAEPLLQAAGERVRAGAPATDRREAIRRARKVRS